MDRNRTARTSPGSGKLTAEQIESAVRRYQSNETLKAIGASLGVSATAIHGLLRRRGIPMRTGAPPSRVTRPDAFATPETDQVAAYLIGFLLADGCLSDRAGRAKSVVLCVQERDRSVVDCLNQFIGGGCTVGVVAAKGRKQAVAQMSFSHPQTVADLERHGMKPRKSFTAELPPHLVANRHVWRGLIDGNGCLRWADIGGRKYPSLGITGSLACVEQFAAFVRGASAGYQGSARPSRSVYEARLVGRHAAVIARILYSDNEFALPRKAALADEFAKWVPARNKRWHKRPEPK